MHPTMQAYLKYHEGAYPSRSPFKFRHAVRVYWEWLDARGIDPTKATLENLHAYQRFIAREHRTKKGRRLSPASQVKRLAAVRGYHRFMERRGMTLVDVSRDLKLPRVVRHATKRDYLSLQEVTALLQTQARRVEATPKEKLKWAIELRNLAFYAMAVATGRRRAGLLDLNLSDVDFERDEIRVSQEKGRTGRVLPIARWAMVVLKEYVEQARPRFLPAASSDLLFVSKRNGTLSHQIGEEPLQQLHQQTVEANPDLTELAGKHLTLHGLRVTFAKLLFTGGCNLRSVNELMLHERLSTTAYYTPLGLEELRSVCRTVHPRA